VTLGQAGSRIWSGRTPAQAAVGEGEAREGRAQGDGPGKLLSPERRRAAVHHPMRVMQVSERFACQVEGEHRTSCVTARPYAGRPRCCLEGVAVAPTNNPQGSENTDAPCDSVTPWGAVSWVGCHCTQQLSTLARKWTDSPGPATVMRRAQVTPTPLFCITFRRWGPPARLPCQFV
jgi:hypothetical protein